MASEPIPTDILPMLDEVVLLEQRRVKLARELSTLDNQISTMCGLFWEQWEKYHPGVEDEEDHRICYKEQRVYWKDTADFYL